MNYKVRIKRPNKIFNIRNIPIRSPFECTIHENSISAIRSRIKFYGLNEEDYEITEESKINDYSCISEGQTKSLETNQIIQPSREKKLSATNNIDNKTKNKTSLRKPLPKPISKNFDDSPRRSFQKVENKIPQPQKINEVIKKEEILVKDKIKEVVPSLKTEQIINVKEFDSEVTEVKIEELNEKSKSLLEKFLHSEF